VPIVSVIVTIFSNQSVGGVALDDKLNILLASTPDAMANTSLQLVACHIFLAANSVREVLQCVHHGLTMEHLAMCVFKYTSRLSGSTWRKMH
jgi:hypothetical protein